MTLLEETCAAIRPVDEGVARRTQALLDAKTKPPGSLGRLEELAVRIAAARGTELPDPPVKAIAVLAADHGVAAQGVSAYPQEVTAQMVANFAAGGAAINALARAAGAEVVVVDMGVKTRVELPGVLSRWMGPGTRDLSVEPAMTRGQATGALEAGIGIARELSERGVTLIGVGEMGIANTTAASALSACLLGADPQAMTGRGTGIGGVALGRKLGVIRRALALHAQPTPAPLDALARLGGFEIAGMAGVALGAAARRIPVVVDGFISSAAALAAIRLAPAAGGYLILAHRSAEPGHGAIADALGTAPLLDLGMRLGEGTGAALAMGLVDAALRALREMATFEGAGVSTRSA